MLFAPLPTEDGTLAIAVSRAGMQWQKTRVPSFEVNQLLDRIRTSIDAALQTRGVSFDTAAASQLYEALVPPGLAGVRTGHADLLYSASGELAALSPALLLTEPSRLTTGPGLADAAWFIQKHSIRVEPTLSLTMATTVAALPGSFIGVRAPVTREHPAALQPEFRGGTADQGAIDRLPALPGAAAELRAIAAELHGNDPVLLLGRDATEARLRAAICAPFATVAFATHGLDAGALTELGELALMLSAPAGGGEPGDSLLTASKIAGFDLRADWVISPACDSGGSSEFGGGAYRGLASAFLQAGAGALLVSHWPVRDDAAARLTVATVSANRRGVPRAAALRQAMLALTHDWRIPQSANPAIWAPLVLVDQRATSDR